MHSLEVATIHSIEFAADAHAHVISDCARNFAACTHHMPVQTMHTDAREGTLS